MAHGLLYGASFKNGVLSFTDKQGRSLCEVSFLKYLTLTAVEDNSSVALKKAGDVTNTYEYRKNGGAWTAYDLTTNGTAISLNAGDRVEWRCTAWKSDYFSSRKYVQFVMTGKISASNPVTSMISPTLNHKTIENDYACWGLFRDCTGLTKAPELPATTLKEYCYNNMFYGCTGLTQAPELPATTLAVRCYSQMFYGCTGLTQAPALPATTLAEHCYRGMFWECTSLTQAPELPATALIDYCYYQMFYKCSGLTQAPELPATTLASYCYEQIFFGCTSLTQAPALPATTLKNYCYRNMFVGCSSLNEVRVSATDISAYNCTTYWLSEVSSTGNFYCDPNTSWTRGVSGIPKNWERWVYGAEDTGTTTTMYYNGASETMRVGTSSYGTCYALQGWVGFKLLAEMHALGYTFGTQTIVTLYEDEHPVSTYACDANDEDGFTETMYDVDDGDGFLTIAQQNEKRIYTEPAPFTGLTLTATENNSSVKLMKRGSRPNKYRVDTGSGWRDYTFGTVINLKAGRSCRWDCIEFYTDCMIESRSVFVMTGKIEASGNCLSMQHRNFKNVTNVEISAFIEMFKDCTALTKAPELPATELFPNCYESMFYGCTSLTQAPELPATTLKNDCYQAMFYGCTGLTQAPELPATTLASNCYQAMFSGCTSLTKAPALPATTLKSYCYQNMFYDCTSLNEVRVSATNISASNCTNGWLSRVSATGDFYCDPNTSWTSGTSGIPANWTRHNIADYPSA